MLNIETNDLRRDLAELTSSLGFAAFGITTAISSTGYSRLVQWIESGYAGQMDYFANRLDAYQHPRGVLPGCRSILCLAFPYPCDLPTQTDVGVGKVARYAWSGTDYHDVIHPKLKRICGQLRKWWPESNARGVVDTAPIMEREVAELAGIGWRGKNTLLLNKQLGSYFFLACVLTDIDLPADDPGHVDHCGTCTACLDACPTHAFPSPGVLDATRCISYLTIEHRGEINRELKGLIGDWVFGCDVCQEVCPWNQKLAKRNQREATGDNSNATLPLRKLPLRELFFLDEQAFRQHFRKTPLWRTRRRGILRNAAIVIANQQDRLALDALRHAASDDDEVVRQTAAWALDQFD